MKPVGVELGASHTPGPWIADSLCMQDDNVVRISAYDGKPDYYHRCMSIAECHVRDDRHDMTSPHVLQAEANARLIAAAPDLLMLAKRMLAAWEGSGPGIVLDDIRQLIAQAEGRS